MSFPRLTAQEAADLIQNGQTVGFSGFTPAGAAKAIPREIAAKAKREHEAGRPFKIGVLTDLSGAYSDLAGSGSVLATKMAIDDFIAKEKEIEMAKMSDKDKSKPAEILEKIISGKVAKIVNEVTLYGQPYVLNTDQSVEAAMKAAGADVIGFQRLAVGEGIEKVVEDYAAEVAKAMQV